MNREEWVVTVGQGPSDLFGPMVYDDARKMTERLKMRARQLDQLHIASTIRMRVLSDQSAYQLDTIINNAV